ncbi:hypothetical protein PFY12_14645 [Chryseobacterium camelliae]|uniref:DUF2281 domain-containing protein n=1 Tax=Chryseobacterium camelliae TaxID=1265445 RepID=A0ABY7QLP7_9FLAO|nr:hypothetical protein [Chryseobacterium camelliae]WBV60264.1 hypothetical protein PFY12_14645 [Chryseobacterium camelliae]
MSRLEELYDKMLDEAPVSFHAMQRAYIMELTEIYAKECSQASLEKASKLPHELYDDEWHIEKIKESITNQENIVLL